LKFVRRGSRLVGASAQDLRPACLDGPRGRHQLLLRFHAAWPGHDHKIAATDLDSIHVDDALLGFGFFTDQFIPLLDGQDPFNLSKGGQRFQSVMRPLIPNRSDNRLKLSVDRVGGVTEFLNFQDDFFDLFFRGFGFEDDNHGKRSKYHIPLERQPRKPASLTNRQRFVSDAGLAGQPDLLVLDLLVQDFTAGGIHALHTSFASSGDAEFDRRIQEMVNDWGVRESHELIAEMIVTALRMGSDSVPVPDLKLINRSLKELRQAAKVFAPYQGIRKIAIFGSARTSPHVEVYQAAERFARLMREHGYMIITGGGDGIMGAAQRGAGRAHSFGLNIRLPFEQKANETIEGDPKLVNFNYFFTRKVNFIKETHAIALFPGGFGTMDEGFECLTLMQTGKARIIPVILIDKIGGTYWKSWTEFLRANLLGQGLISPDDFSLFTITEDVDEAVRMVLRFYQNFHSYRWVGQDLVIRLHRQLTSGAVEDLNKSFSDLFESTPLRKSRALKPEKNEPELSNMPRLLAGSHRRNFGRLRQLLDAINEAETIGE
jgi:uncharacterized protein (TIGR00730 family)